MNRWTAREDAELRAAAAADETFSAVAQRLGRTRSMVAGRVNRLGLRFDSTDRAGRISAGMYAYWARLKEAAKATAPQQTGGAS